MAIICFCGNSGVFTVLAAVYGLALFRRSGSQKEVVMKILPSVRPIFTNSIYISLRALIGLQKKYPFSHAVTNLLCMSIPVFSWSC